MAPNLGVTCSPYSFKACVNGATEARKLFGQADHRAQDLQPMAIMLQFMRPASCADGGWARRRI
jgi:hypothetical protein